MALKQFAYISKGHPLKKRRHDRFLNNAKFGRGSRRNSGKQPTSSNIHNAA